MHFFVRPDASGALEDEGVQKALGRYRGIIKGEKVANFIIAKRVPVEIDLDSNSEILWQAHEKAMGDYFELKENADAGKNIAPPPDHSLLDLKIELASRILESCHFCHRRCGIDRKKGEKGFCGLDAGAYLSSEFVHWGEEACLVPSHTFFFVGCPFYCIYCQNWSISRNMEKGVEVSGSQLALMAEKRRESEDTRNVNLVGGSPTPNIFTILEMLRALDMNIPIVWNSNMYMSLESMNLLEGAIDVYLADFKYGNDDCAKRLSKVKDYWQVTTRNLSKCKRDGELLIRHLVLPNHLECCTGPVLKWITDEFRNSARVNIMDQYHPEFEAEGEKDITRRVTREEMKKAFEIAKELGLENLD